jgi:hypothetical protein
LQRFQQGKVLGNIVVLAPDALGDSDGAVRGAVHHHSNTRRAGIPERAAIDVGHEV